MDPEMAWKDLREAYAEGNLDEMEASAGDLLEWLDQGGFPPQTTGDPPMDEHWNRTIARTACTFVLNAAAHRRRQKP